MGFAHEHPWMVFWLIVFALMVIDSAFTNFARVRAIGAASELQKEDEAGE